MTDVSQIARDHGADARAALAVLMTNSTIQPLVDGVGLEGQLKQARRVVCVPGQRDPACADLVEMTLRLTANPETESAIRADFAIFIERVVVTVLPSEANAADGMAASG